MCINRLYVLYTDKCSKKQYGGRYTTRYKNFECLNMLITRKSGTNWLYGTDVPQVTRTARISVANKMMELQK